MLFNQTSRIIKEKNLFSIDYIPNKIIGREEEIKDLAFHLSYFFREHPSLPCITIYGSTGSGKTAVTNYVLKEFKKEAEKLKPEENLKIVYVRGSETRTKFEILKKILSQLEPDADVSNTKADLYSELVKILSERGYNLLIFIDEVHDIYRPDINEVIYTVSRIGEDISYSNPKQGISKPKKSHIGYILISNDLNLRDKLKENTKSSFTHERMFFKRYDAKEITSILKDRIKQGALFEGKIDEECLSMISGLSVNEGLDARYALRLLSNVSKEAEKRNMEKITMELIGEINEVAKKDLIKDTIDNLSSMHLTVLEIIYQLYERGEKINSGTIYEWYCKNPSNSKREYSRISQIVTDLEKEDIIYVTTSKNTKLRDFSIHEYAEEIKEGLKQKGRLNG